MPGRKLDLSINKETPIGKICQSLDICTFNQAVQYIRKLPYGRNTSRHNFSLVLTEGKGTCSSKHGFLKSLAEENDIENVKLILVFYKMNETNTPGVGRVLDQFALSYIPEAHCVLKVKDLVIDVTSSNSDFGQLSKDVIDTRIISVGDIAEKKPIWHREYLQNWLQKSSLTYTIDQLWQIREACINSL